MAYSARKAAERIESARRLDKDPDARVYLLVPYPQKGLAKAAGCIWDSEKKLWYTGADNPRLQGIMRFFKVSSKDTGKKAKEEPAKKELQK